MTRKHILPIVCFVLLVFAAPAIAGGGGGGSDSGKKCGQDIPTGPYAKGCQRRWWVNDNLFRVSCTSPAVMDTISCDRVKSCKWKLAFNGINRLDCD